MTSRFLPLLFLLAACVSPEQQAQQRAATDQNQCSNYGFAVGTDAYAQCRMTIDQQRRARSAAIAGAILSRPAPQPYTMPTNPSITCNTFGNTTTCR
jgi:hypothetical protein